MLPDDFYVFSERSVPPPPSVIPASQLTPETDLVSTALALEGPGSEEVVSLAGAKSGLRISFATNRASILLIVLATRAHSGSRHGLQRRACSSTPTT